MDYVKKGFIFIALLAIGFACYTLFGVYDNGTTVDSIRGEILSLREDNKRINAELATVKQGLADSRREIRESREVVVTVRQRIEQDGVSLEEARRIIGEGKLLTDTIRKGK